MMSPPGSRDRLLNARVATTGAVLGALGGLYLVNPNSTHVPLCPFHAMTGLWCPFCGCTRAAHELLHAEIATALRDNALFVLAAPIALVTLIGWLTGRRPRSVARKWHWASAIVLLVFGVLRNLPAGSWLAPPT